MINGEMGTGEHQHSRWCEGCNQYHGPLYLCEKYPGDIKKHIQLQNDEYITNLRNPAWCQKQMDNGLPAVGVMIFRTLAGLDFDDWRKNAEPV